MRGAISFLIVFAACTSAALVENSFDDASQNTGISATTATQIPTSPIQGDKGNVLLQVEKGGLIKQIIDDPESLMEANDANDQTEGSARRRRRRRRRRRTTTPAPTPAPTTTPVPTPTPSGSAPAGPRPSDSNLAAVLDRHNKYRCMHGLPSLKWNEAIARNADDWAQATGGQMKHSSSQSRKGVGGFSYLGENLASGATGTNGVDMWYDEIELTSGGVVSSFSSGTGHYTQVVWKATTDLGCAVNGRLLVCQYGVGGNMGGQFGQNVNGPVKSSSQCPDGASGGGGSGETTPTPTPSSRPTPTPTPTPIPAPTPAAAPPSPPSRRPSRQGGMAPAPPRSRRPSRQGGMAPAPAPPSPPSRQPSGRGGMARERHMKMMHNMKFRPRRPMRGRSNRGGWR